MIFGCRGMDRFQQQFFLTHWFAALVWFVSGAFGRRQFALGSSRMGGNVTAAGRGGGGGVMLRGTVHCVGRVPRVFRFVVVGMVMVMMTGGGG